MKSLKKRSRRTSNTANITSKTCKHQKRTLLEQIGFNLEKHTENQWVYYNDQMVYRSISYVPVFYKMFEVIFKNAADCIKSSNPSMDCLKVNIDPLKNTVSVYYNGRSVYAGYRYQNERVADATMLMKNDFCTEFVIEIADGLHLEKFKQVFTNNMKKKSKPKITKCKAREDWTKLTFKPNLKKFKMAHLEEDVVALMKKRVLDMAESLGKTVKVELNDRLVRIIESFEDYAVLCMKFAEKSRPVNAIELALSEEKAEYRNSWNRYFEPGKELILFSSPDLKRSIPSVVDGLKPDQRKVLFCVFKTKLYEEINVGEFIGYVSRHSACHNGEESLGCTIIEMAQDFVGSNNINLLKLNDQFGTRDFGQFGTRVFGHKNLNLASARWISTELNPVTRCLFHEDDDKLLDYLNVDGRSIEPNWYIPIIPLVLVNGSGGIGAGWTSIPSYDPRKIIANVKRLLTCEDMVPMDPCYERFKGTIEKTAKKGEYRVSGHMMKIGEQTFRITELPIGMWTKDYQEFLESICDWSPNVKDPLIEDINMNMKDYANVDITIKIKSDKIASLNKLSQKELYEKFKLISTVSTNNMHLFDAEGKIKKFDNPEQILKEFYALRLPYYDKRKENVLAKLCQHILILENKARFLSGALKGDIIFRNRPKFELISELKQKGFTPMPRKGKFAEPQVSGANDDNSEAQEDDNNKEEGTWGGYEYLICIHFSYFAKENVAKLLAKMVKKMDEFNVLKERSSSEMWMMDLVELEKKIDEINRKEEVEKERKRSSQAGKTAKTQNVEPENDNTSMEVDNVVEVAKPKGRAGSPKTQKDRDDITSLQQCLDAYYKSSSSSEITGAMESEVAAAKKRRVVTDYIINMLLARKKHGSILDTEMETEALRLATHFSSLSESIESETEGLGLKVFHRGPKYMKSESSESESSESETEGLGLKVFHRGPKYMNSESSESDHDDSGSKSENSESESSESDHDDSGSKFTHSVCSACADSDDSDSDDSDDIAKFYYDSDFEED